MKKARLALVAVAVVAMAGSAMAASTKIDVTAKIVGTCQFNISGTLSFGTLDQTSSSDKVLTNSASGAKFWCTKNSIYAVSANKGLNGSGTIYNLKSGSDLIEYDFAIANPGGSGGGKNSPIEVLINASIPNSRFIDAPAGDYTDTVTLTVIP